MYLRKVACFQLNCSACPVFQLFEMKPYIRCKQTEIHYEMKYNFELNSLAVKNDNDTSVDHDDSKSTWFYRFNKGKKLIRLLFHLFYPTPLQCFRIFQK